MSYKFNPFTGNLDIVPTIKEDILINLSNEYATLTVGTAYTIQRWPRDYVVTGLPTWMVNLPAKGAALKFDIKVAGASIFATLPTIDANENGSDTAAAPGVFSAAFIAAGQVIAKNAVVSFHVTQIGSDSDSPGGGAKVSIPVKGVG